jgi:hypothetical protein
LKKIVTSILMVFLAGCATSEKLPCATTDWYELGRRNGTQGGSEEEVKALKPACGTEDEKADALALYENGRSLGLAEYCTEENGFEMGRTGQKYAKVCPIILEEAFLAGYKRGQSVSKLQSVDDKLKKPHLGFIRKGILEGQRLQLLQDQKEPDVATAGDSSKRF